MTTTPHFSVRDLAYQYVSDGFIITVTTDIPCHLWMRWTTLEPQIHTVPRYIRGTYLHGDKYFCFTTFDENEQAEAGDTLIHTFIKRSWPICQTRYFYFRGTVAGENSPSTTAIFSLHFTIASTTYIDTASNRTIQGNSVNWNTCHNAPSGFIGPWHNPPLYRIVVGATLTASYWIERGYLFFNTSMIPPGLEIVGGSLSLYLQSHIRDSSATYPYIQVTQGVQHNPVVATDYGDQLPYTTVYGQRDIATFINGVYNQIGLENTIAGIINPTGLTRLCLRQQMDVENHAPPLGSNQIAFNSNQAALGSRPLLTLYHPPPVP